MIEEKISDASYLAKKAKEYAKHHPRKRMIGSAEIELAIAWAMGEIGIYDATRALYGDTRHSAGAYGILARALKAACNTGLLERPKP